MGDVVEAKPRDRASQIEKHRHPPEERERLSGGGSQQRHAHARRGAEGDRVCEAVELCPERALRIAAAKESLTFRPESLERLTIIGEHVARSGNEAAVRRLIAAWSSSNRVAAEAMISGVARSWPRDRSVELSPAEEQQPMAAGADPVAQFVRETKKVGRNEPCPCGSGKKYKHCHGALAKEG